MNQFLKKWWPPLIMLPVVLLGAGYVAFIDLPRIQDRQAATLAWAKEECTPVTFTDKSGADSTAYRCHHIMQPKKGRLVYIQGVLGNGGFWAWQKNSNSKLKAVWTVPVDCLRRPASFSGLELCSTVAVEPEEFKSRLADLFAE